MDSGQQLGITTMARSEAMLENRQYIMIVKMSTYMVANNVLK